MIKYTRIAKFAAAALVAAVTLGAATGAQAIQNTQSFLQNQGGGTYWNHQNHYNHYNHNYGYNYGPGYGYGYGYNGGGELVAGLLGGLFAGTVVNSYNQPYYDENSCYRFKTYNPTTGMYMSNHGPRHCP
jgi:hypothetical protein